ncbi:MAG: C39 family peptidase [Sporolactobacillus sp.]
MKKLIRLINYPIRNRRRTLIFLIFSALLLVTACRASTTRAVQPQIQLAQVPTVRSLGQAFHPREKVKVLDQNGHQLPLSGLRVNNTVDSSRTGVYTVRYRYRSADQAEQSKSLNIRVIYQKKLPLPYKTNIQKDASMLKGHTKILQKGQTGIQIVRYEAKRLGGEIKQGRELASEKIKKSTAEIRIIGSKTPADWKMNVPIVRQRPELPTGCEITAVTMMLRYKGIDISKLTLAKEMPRSTDGDPNQGFVGSPYLKSGSTIYPPALMNLVRGYAGSAVNLTGVTINELKDHLSDNKPIVIWGTFDGFNYHAVTLTGYTKDGFYYNDPWTGTSRTFSTSEMLMGWGALQKRALSY